MKVSLLTLGGAVALVLSSCSSNDVNVVDGSNSGKSGGRGTVNQVVNAPGGLINGVLRSVPVLNAITIPNIPLGF